MSPQFIVGKNYTKWCGYCKVIKDEYENIKTRFKKDNITFMDFDGDNSLKENIQKLYGDKKVPAELFNGFPTLFVINKDTWETKIYNGKNIKNPDEPNATPNPEFEKWLTEIVNEKKGGRRKRGLSRRRKQKGGYKWSVRVSRKKTKRTASKRAAVAAAADTATTYTKK
jgi:thiol-disulfide isomerase/thioredoxin